MASCSVFEQAAFAARLTLMMFAAGRDAMVPASVVTPIPADQRIAAAISEMRPEHLPMTRTGRIVVSGAMPAMPMPLLATAPMTPATLVPCQELFAWLVQSAC